ncbi:hypothetical protein CPLU01_03404 [Colletotrichum plurivorum]|uniref:SUR7 protein n=1 Tax=Colletotrichum plurivorum TaxID=2175906 RepID=A0A8H6NL52_9PEZI|nr:hypothetical protein CPLU01_03404 [Colletotrichum plurivorum]
MDTHTEDGASASAQKFIFTRKEERKIRHRLLGTAFVFDAVAVALIFPLCIGGWIFSSSKNSGSINGGDAHLATWSVTYQRNQSLRESTFAMTWFLSSTCYQEVYVDQKLSLSGCIHRTPGSPLDLQSIMEDMDARLAEDQNVSDMPFGPQEGRFEAPETVPSSYRLNQAGTISWTRNAVVTYGIFLGVTLGSWVWHVVARRHRYVFGASIAQGYSLTTAQILSLLALLAASCLTTAAAYKADRILGHNREFFNYHAKGTTYAILTWGAFVSHLLGVLAFAASAWMWQRLQRPELYPPEPEPEIPGHGGGGAWQQRQQRQGRPGVHREADPSAPVDDELPPYSRVDPNEGSGTQSAEQLVETRRSHDAGGVPAPAYELHDWPRNEGSQRETRGN